MNIVCPIDCYTGYGITGYNIWKNIYKTDPSTILFMLGGGNLEQSWDHQSIKKSVANQVNFDKNKPCFKLWHGNELFTRAYGSSKYGVLSFFEINKLSELEKKSYSLADIVFMPSLWAKNVLLDNGIKSEIVVCPQGVDTSIFNSNTPEDKHQNNKYVFINIGKWEIRKGHDILVDIFNNAFEKEDNVELWMVNHNPFLNSEQTQQWVDLYQSSKLKDKIRFFPRLPTQEVLAKVISYSDCGIFPSRAEGWNNEAIELMAMNKPLIITNYSAHTQYCTSDNSYLIDIDDIEPAHDDIWFHGEGEWATIDNKQIEQAVEHMRYAYTNKIKTNPEGLKTAQIHSWEKTADILYSNLYDGVSLK
jgi:glycosyltransferase involved in cell wall biosynthesis